MRAKQLSMSERDLIATINVRAGGSSAPSTASVMKNSKLGGDAQLSAQPTTMESVGGIDFHLKPRGKVVSSPR